MTDSLRFNVDPSRSNVDPSASDVTAQPSGGRAASVRPVIEPEQLSFHRLSPRHAGPADLPLLGAAYQCWSEVWKQTFTELEGRSTLPSDDFTRQDEIGALFHGYECVALFFSRQVDLSSPLARDDSYFSVWSKEARRAACARGSRVWVSSNITIAPKWRKPANVALSSLVCALIIERFLLSDADVLVGTMRNDRKMNTVTYGLGAQPIAHGVIHHGVPVDLVAFYRDSCVRTLLDEETEALVQALKPRDTSAGSV
jgi:hypothetical protein